MKKKNKNTNQKRGNTPKGTYSLDEYRSKKSSTYQSYRTPIDNNREVKKTYNPYTSDYQSNNYSASYSNPYTHPYSSYSSASYSSDRKKDPQVVRQEIKQKNKISRKEAERLKRRKKAIQRRNIVIVILAVMLGVYGSIKLVDHFVYPTVSYQTVQTGIIDNSEKVQGLIVREEIVYTSPYEGSVHYLTGEGQKVRKGGEVCYVSQDEKVSEVATQIESVDSSIYNIQDKRENLSEYQTEIYNLNNGITNEIKDFYNNRNTQKTNVVYTLRKQLDRIIQTRTDLYINEPTNRTESLQQDRLALVKNLNDYHNVILSKEAGMVSYVIDGQESIIKGSQVEAIDFKKYQDILKGKKVNQTSKSVGESTINSPLYKLITDDKWQIITYINEEKSGQFTENESYEFTFDEIGNTKVNFKLVQKVPEGENIKLVFTARDQLVKFLPYRVVEFTIGENKAEGLKIPISAIVEKNVLKIPNEYIVQKEREQGVIRETGESTEFIPINVQYSDKEYAYILQDLSDLKGIQVNQTIIEANTKKKFIVSDVAAVQGVYTINGRYAKFKQIDIVLLNEAYAIIKENSQLKEFDQIISNPKSIKEDQLLKSMNIQNE